MDFVSEIKKPNSGEIAIGFDLTDTFSQVSFGYIDAEEVHTLSTVAGSTNYRVPTALFKRKEVNQWFAGKEALKNKDGDGYYVDKLLSKARAGKEIFVGEESFRPSALIALFMKRTLSLVSMVAPLNRVVSFMVTVDELDEDIVTVLSEAVASLGLKTQNIFFQSHMESFYYYTIYQDPSLWKNDVLLLDFSGEFVKSLRMECNKNTTPVVAFIDNNSFHSFGTGNLDSVDPDSDEARNYDERLTSIVEELTSSRILSSIYFIGDAFSQSVFKDSVKLMCRKGRVFEGNNLYSKGAAFAAKNRIVGTILSDSHVFLGNDKLKSNVGINVMFKGEEKYLALLDAGVNWFEAKKECDFILDKGNKLSFVITPLTGKDPEVCDITLQDLPKRPPRTTRLHIEMSMLSESRLSLEIKDLGFGELFPASNTEWKEVINV